MSKDLRKLVTTDPEIVALEEEIKVARQAIEDNYSRQKNELLKMTQRLEAMIKAKLPARPEVITLEWLMDQDWPLVSSVYNLYNEARDCFQKECPELTDTCGFWEETKQIGLALNDHVEWKADRIKRCLDLCKAVKVFNNSNYRGGIIEFGEDWYFMLAKKEGEGTYQILSRDGIVFDNPDFNKVLEVAQKVCRGDHTDLKFI